MADGIYGHAVAELYIPLHSYVPSQTKGIVGFVIEDRYEFGKTDGEYTLGGNVFLVGLTLRFL